MKIKQVEELAGITVKNIRFYEDEGLITPNRAENGYREYDLKDVERLKTIKFFRKLGIPVESIKQMLEGKLSMEDSLQNRLKSLKEEEKRNANNRALCEELIGQQLSDNAFNVDEMLDRMDRMEKEGTDFVDLSKIDIHVKKKTGAILGGGIMIVYMLAMIGLVVWMRSVETPIPLPMAVILIGILTLTAAAIVYSIVSRVREINGGEEDEASKY